MSLPLYDGGIASALLTGILFGYVLEGSGFGSPRKMVAQFTLKDFAVFKVMFTAVIVAAVGLWLLEIGGLLKPGSFFVPTMYFGAFAVGGVLIGAGFAIGGYCPGTSATGLASGRLDALAFMAGMVAGVGIFAGVFEKIHAFYIFGQGPKGQTLSQLLGLPAIIILVALIVVAAAGFALANRLERRRGGPLTVEDTQH